MLVRTERVVFVLHIFYNFIYSQPIAEDEFNIIRQSRQVDFEACCPCPDNSNRYTDFRYPAIMSSVGRQNDEFQIKNDNRFPNDSQYPSRSTDNEGSSSIFFPKSVRADKPTTRPSNQKDELKNLLEPEVDLASSVLETIREATEVEYQDALAREAAKTRTADDAIANESASNMFTIILPSDNRDNDDALLSEATHVHESRCIQPVGSSLSKIRTLKTLPRTFMEKLSQVRKAKSGGLLHKNILDMNNNVQASNVQERFSQQNHPGLKLKKKPELVESRHENSCITDSKLNSRTGQMISLDEQTNKSDKENLAGLKEDLQVQPSNVKSLSLLPSKDLFKVKNLLKLRDTEFISPTKKIDIPLLTLPSIFDRQLPDLADILRSNNYLKHTNDWSSIRNCDNTSEDNGFNKKTNIVEKSPALTFNEMKEKDGTSKNVDLHQLLNKPINPTSKTIQTEIIDTLSSPSESIFIVNLDDNNEKKHEVLPKDALKDNEDVCTNIDQAYEDIEITSDEQNQTPDLISDTVDDDDNISDANDEDDPNNQFSIESEDNDELTNNDCFEHAIDGREDAGSDTQVIENIDNPDSDIKPVDIIDQPLNSGYDKKTSLFNNLSLNGVTSIVNKNISSPLSKSLTSLKQDIQKKIQEFRNTPSLITQQTFKEITGNNKQNELKSENRESTSDTDCQNAASIAQIEQNNPNDDRNKIVDNISMEDLQKMSDSLLKMNELKQKLVDPENSKNNRIENADLMSTENLPTEINSKDLFNSRIPSATMKNLQNLKEEKSDKSILKNKNSLDEQTKTYINSEQLENNSHIEATSSRSIDKNNRQKGPLSKGVEPDEMTAEASDPIKSALDPLNLFSKLKSPLLQDIIVQPSSLDDLNPLSDGSEFDLSSLLNIPTLDEIRERLANVFDTRERDSEHQGIDCETNSPIMSSEPSEPIFHSIPLSKPLEDVDIDIFQLKPLKIGESNLLSEIPRLNLKSYKAKLPIPKNLQLKPMKLESTLGNSGGLLGATFRVGPESELKNILGSPLGKSIKIEEVTSQLRDNVESLLNIPLNTLQDLRPNPNTYTEDLRAQTLNTIKGIQDNIGNPLKIVQNGKPRNGFIESSDGFLEKITDATDDLNDKLKGIHHDLNDRLLSIHENILDKTKLTSVSNSLFDDISSKAKQNMLNPLQRRNLSKSHMERLTTERGKKNNNSPQLRSSKINGNDKIILKSYKKPSSASVSVPKSVSVPNLKQMGTKLPLSNLQRNLNVKHVPHGMIREESKNQPVVSIPSQFKRLNTKQNTHKPTNSLKETKVKVTIVPTTLSPLSALKSRKVINPELKTKKNNILTQPENRFGKSQLKNKQDFDTVESAPEMKKVPSQIVYPRKLERTQNEDIISKTDIKKTMESATMTPIKEWLKQRQASKTLTSNKVDKKGATKEGSPTLDVLKSETASQPLKKEVNSWPEITEKSFLSKIRDAVKSRVSNLDLAKTMKGNKNSDVILDTEKAASETTEVVVSETLKENVSYKCKMVCTKET